jgi:hypothetical protein
LLGVDKIDRVKLADGCCICPPYSPDLYRIEQLWANLKRRWRKTGGALKNLIAMSYY